MSSIFEDQKKLLILSAFSNLCLLGALAISRSGKSHTNKSDDQSKESSPGEAGLSRPRIIRNASFEKVIDPLSLLKKQDDNYSSLPAPVKDKLSKDIYTVNITGGPCAGKTTGTLV